MTPDEKERAAIRIFQRATQAIFEANVRKWIRRELGELETDEIDW